jgi:hypothetical protein
MMNDVDVELFELSPFPTLLLFTPTVHPKQTESKEAKARVSIGGCPILMSQEKVYLSGEYKPLC